MLSNHYFCLFLLQSCVPTDIRLINFTVQPLDLLVFYQDCEVYVSKYDKKCITTALPTLPLFRNNGFSVQDSLKRGPSNLYELQK